MLVFDAVGEIDAIRQNADLRLQNVSGRGRAMRNVPALFPIEEGSLFLRAGERDTKFVIGVDA